MVLKAIVGRVRGRAESPAALVAAIAATSAGLRLVEAVPDGGGRFRAGGVGAAGRLHFGQSSG